MESSSTPHFIVLNELVGNQPATLNTFQKIIAPYADTLAVAWFALWCTVAVVVLLKLIRDIREERRKHRI